ncbi:hypothetical protein SAMN05660485_01588 [Blastococcus fimeti]|nr:hypothetical protein SAMN05660485_01588 [Blastococcus fimeti]
MDETDVERWLQAQPAVAPTADGRPVWRVPIGDLLARVQPAYGSADWADHRRRMLDDPDERERVTTLAAIAAGGFRQPVILDTEDGRIANGMHRIVASIVAGLPHVDVTDRYSEIERPQLRIEFALGVPPEHRFGDAHDAADSLLWSFPVGDEWAETDTLYNADPLLGGYWYWPADRADELVAEMTSRAAVHGLTFTAHTVEPHSWDEEDDL